jgi:methionyl aminopeptidase
MRQAGLVVWLAHQKAAALVRPGVTTAELDATVAQVFAHYSAVSLFLGVPGVKYPFPAVSCISVNDELVHGIPGPRALGEGDIVSIDTGCKLNGWCGDAALTHPVGRVAADVGRLVDVTRDTLHLAIRLLATERWWSAVARQMAAFVAQAGFSVVEQFVGHGIGREMHEPPQVPNFDSPRLRQQDIELLPGLVLAIEPMVNLGVKRVRRLADHWTHATADGRPSAHFEHTVALTEQGPWVLTGPPSSPEEEAFVTW